MELHFRKDPVGGGRRRVGALVLLTLAAVAGASCGTRVQQATEGASASPLAGAPAVETTSPAASGGVGDSTPGAEAAVPLGGSASSGGGAVGGKDVASGSRGTQASSGGATPGGTVSTGPGTAAVGGPAPSKPALPAPGSGGGNRGPEPTGTRSPVIVASVGTYSGPAGVALAPMLQGVQLWVKHVNERGGLNGHSVRLLSYDDGGDPARHRAQVQEAVEGKHAIAFVMNAEGIGTGEGSVAYLNAKRVPVIGMDGGSGWAYSSPMYFPQMSQGPYNTRMTVPSIARQLIPQGKTKLGTLICVEAPICDETDTVVAESVKGSGLEHVYRGRASIAQPDFTAECLSARNAGAQILFFTLDQNSVARVAASCARQGYRPTFSVVQQVASRTMADSPDFEGGTTASPVAPYVQSGTPATDEFQAATRASGIASGNGFGGGTMLAWAAGKLLEKAGAKMTEPPTSEALLAELWSMKNETLGGLVPPTTFVKDQPPKPYTCWYDMTIKNKVWISPDGFKLYCL